MPLLKGNNSETISKNIGELISAGHPKAQAAAIAYRVAGRDDAGETYIDVLHQAKKMENEAISIGLKLLSLAPPGDIDALVEITGDENDHDAIYTAMLSRYETEGE